MGYTPTEWNTGDVITEEKLNNIEAGIADGGLPKNTQTTKTIFDGTYTFAGDEGGPYNSDPIPPMRP